MLPVPGGNVCFVFSDSDSQQSPQCSRWGSQPEIPTRDPNHCLAPVSPSHAHSLPWPRFSPWNGCLGTRENQLRGQVEPSLWRSWDPAASFPSEWLFGTGGFGGSRAGAGAARALTELCRTPHTGHRAQPGGPPDLHCSPTPQQQQQGQPIPGSQRGTGGTGEVAGRVERVSPLAPVGPCSPPGIAHPRGSRRDSPGGFGC